MRRAAAVVALAVFLGASAGCGGGSKPDAGGFSKDERTAAQNGLDTLIRTSISSIVLTNTTQDGIPVCRVHLERKQPATFRLLVLWNPRGQFAPSETGNTYSWLTVLLREQGPNLQTWRLANVADASSVKRVLGRTLAHPVEPCQVLNSGRIQLINSSPEIDAQTASLRHIGTTLSNAVAKPFKLQRLDAQGAVTVHPGSQVTVLSFWSTSCATCAALAKRLQEQWLLWRHKGVLVVGVNEFDFVGDARAFVRQQRITYPSLHDSGRVGKRYNVNEIPETFVIDREGRIAARLVGLPSRAKLDSEVQRAIAH